MRNISRFQGKMTIHRVGARGCHLKEIPHAKYVLGYVQNAGSETQVENEGKGQSPLHKSSQQPTVLYLLTKLSVCVYVPLSTPSIA